MSLACRGAAWLDTGPEHPEGGAGAQLCDVLAAPCGNDIGPHTEKELPDAFLRRCFFHYIDFPSKETMMKIVDVHYPNIQASLVKEAMEVFFDIRKVPGLKKKPSTSELIDWLKLLMADEIGVDLLRDTDRTKAIPPMAGALVKNEQDVQLLEKLAFMSRRRG